MMSECGSCGVVGDGGAPKSNTPVQSHLWCRQMGANARPLLRVTYAYIGTCLGMSRMQQQSREQGGDKV